MSPLLEVRDLAVAYGAIKAVSAVSFTVEAGQIVSLIGSNGAGKTTTLRTISGLLRPVAGEIHFDGQRIDRLPAHEILARGVAHSPEGRRLFGRMTVEENLRIGLSSGRKKLKEIPEQIFAMFPVLKQMLRRRGGDLSGGQQQQLAIGRAMILEPKLLILDEPTEGIQPNIVHEIGDIILRLNREAKLTVLLVEQKLPFARRVASEFRIIDKGRIVSSGFIPELTDELVHQHVVHGPCE